MQKKEITFIYDNSAQISMYKPIVAEAERRGYTTKMTQNILEKCEIGFYCHHINFPQHSKFSVIMLHDIIQQYSNWPDIWYREPWNKYDIGILPSKQWVDNWNACSKYFYANPRLGMYLVGWPKADVINEIKKNSSKEEFYAKHNLDLNKKTVLYAPAWENDNKQDDFVQAMIKLDVNILVKQAPWNEAKWPQIVKNIKEMECLHSSNSRVVILPPVTNIFEAIAVSDLLVSEESSTMCEALMMGIPAVSVSDWLIPDTTPSRFPKCDYDFVIKTKKSQLSDCVKAIVDNYDSYRVSAEEFAKNNFSNIGDSSRIIMNIVDDAISGNTIRYEPIKPQNRERVKVAKLIMFWLMSFKRELDENYAVKCKPLGEILVFLRKIKHKLLM
ncbi:hypothetical protein DWW10_17570 [Bacteroides intestinalis]|jgi:hypothetical protein|uniref:CDP-Glycerol:Poly(Glycerophosphate) glycerophosphotransferase n=1 Tax=Bacteroides intestinalis TaxID=329854 RepID=A0A412XZ67_9BACE|nr:CDP-glycerol glycerophosphotransferase family protein [Bacteroides intestinalis]RGV50582.1 hypothetical protein DWW10_17570 [Bacteroides intestinalis]